MQLKHRSNAHEQVLWNDVVVQRHLKLWQKHREASIAHAKRPVQHPEVVLNSWQVLETYKVDIVVRARQAEVQYLSNPKLQRQHLAGNDSRVLANGVTSSKNFASKVFIWTKRSFFPPQFLLYLENTFLRSWATTQTSTDCLEARWKPVLRLRQQMSPFGLNYALQRPQSSHVSPTCSSIFSIKMNFRQLWLVIKVKRLLFEGVIQFLVDCAVHLPQTSDKNLGSTIRGKVHFFVQSMQRVFETCRLTGSIMISDRRKHTSLHFYEFLVVFRLRLKIIWKKISQKIVSLHFRFMHRPNETFSIFWNYTSFMVDYKKWILQYLPRNFWIVNIM